MNLEVDVTENMPSVAFGPSAELAELLRQAARRLQRGAKEALAPLGLSGSQARLVRLLADGPLRMSVIAERLAVVARTVTDVVDGAELAGVVSRRADTADRRSIFVELTPAGHRLLDQLDAARTESAARVFGVLTGPQRNQMLALLKAICASDEGCIESLATAEAAATPEAAATAAPDVTAGTRAGR